MEGEFEVLAQDLRMLLQLASRRKEKQTVAIIDKPRIAFDAGVRPAGKSGLR
jgi:hypothetical protein